MVDSRGVEPHARRVLGYSQLTHHCVLIDTILYNLERTRGLEPLPSVWKTVMLPLNTMPALLTYVYEDVI